MPHSRARLLLAHTYGTHAVQHKSRERLHRLQPQKGAWPLPEPSGLSLSYDSKVCLGHRIFNNRDGLQSLQCSAVVAAQEPCFQITFDSSMPAMLFFLARRHEITRQQYGLPTVYTTVICYIMKYDAHVATACTLPSTSTQSTIYLRS